MPLHGRLRAVLGDTLLLDDDLAKALDRADVSAEAFKDHMLNGSLSSGSRHRLNRYVPVWRPENPPAEISLAEEGILAVIWATGFHSDFSWISL